MFRSWPPLLRGVAAALLLGLNTLFWCGALFAAALVKLVVPFERARAVIDHVLNAIATQWIAGNSAWMRATQSTAWDVEGFDNLVYGGWYLVTSNHQSWVDILVLQHLLNRRIPLLKFFLKRQLIYVPVMGLAWWALEFPFMRRHSAAALKKRPELREQDVNAARRACEKFARVPTSVMNFVEGTRFTLAKHEAQQSPYRHLLKPKAGAMALALEVLGSRFDSLLDVTIVYPGGVPTFWDFMCGRVPRILVRAQRVSIPPEIARGDYTNDLAYRQRFQQWLEALWRDKDGLIGTLAQDASSGTRGQPPLPSPEARDRTPA